MKTPSSAVRQLLVMRHAKSSWSDPGARDFDRSLNARGEQAAPLMGQRLREAELKVDIILASTARRVRETLSLLMPAWGQTAPIAWEQQIYLAPLELLLSVVAALDTDWSSAMIVGHNPGLSDLVSHLTQSAVDMPTAAIAILQCESADWPSAVKNQPWREIGFWTPKD